MRKAFDANVPKLRPRLRPTEVAPATEQESAATAAVAADVDPVAATPSPQPSPPLHGGEGDTAEHEMETAELAGQMREALARTETAEEQEPPSPPPRGGEGRGEGTHHAPVAPPSAAPTLAFTEAPDFQARRERLEHVKRKVQAAMRAQPPMPALPETPARAGESALALVKDLEAQLARSREAEEALRADLDQARAELARGAAENRRVAERLAAVEAQVEEKRAVLEEMLGEMRALEDERDGSVQRAQALGALDEERQALLDGLSTRAEAAEKARGEAEAEMRRLEGELDERAADAARLRQALGQVTRERDDLARELDATRKERDELADARRALEQVHEALATARARLG